MGDEETVFNINKANKAEIVEEILKIKPDATKEDLEKSTVEQLKKIYEDNKPPDEDTTTLDDGNPEDGPKEELELKGKKKFILNVDKGKALFAVKNIGVTPEGVEVAVDPKTKKCPCRRIQKIKGRSIIIEPNEIIVVSVSLKRFFSEKKGYEIEPVK